MSLERSVANDGKRAATKIFRSISHTAVPRICDHHFPPKGVICIGRRSLRSVVTLVGGILEYGCLGTCIRRARPECHWGVMVKRMVANGRMGKY